MTNGNDAAYARDGKYKRDVDAWSKDGLTKREYFAALAMQGVVTAWSEGGIPWHEGNPKIIAERAVEQADALITALNEAK